MAETSSAPSPRPRFTFGLGLVERQRLATLQKDLVAQKELAGKCEAWSKQIAGRVQSAPQVCWTGAVSAPRDCHSWCLLELARALAGSFTSMLHNPEAALVLQEVRPPPLRRSTTVLGGPPPPKATARPSAGTSPMPPARYWRPPRYWRSLTGGGLLRRPSMNPVYAESAAAQRGWKASEIARASGEHALGEHWKTQLLENKLSLQGPPPLLGYDRASPPPSFGRAAATAPQESELPSPVLEIVFRDTTGAREERVVFHARVARWPRFSVTVRAAPRGAEESKALESLAVALGARAAVQPRTPRSMPGDAQDTEAASYTVADGGREVSIRSRVPIPAIAVAERSGQQDRPPPPPREQEEEEEEIESPYYAWGDPGSIVAEPETMAASLQEEGVGQKRRRMPGSEIESELGNQRKRFKESGRERLDRERDSAIGKLFALMLDGPWSRGYTSMEIRLHVPVTGPIMTSPPGARFRALLPRPGQLASPAGRAAVALLRADVPPSKAMDTLFQFPRDWLLTADAWDLTKGLGRLALRRRLDKPGQKIDRRLLAAGRGRGRGARSVREYVPPSRGVATL